MSIKTHLTTSGNSRAVRLPKVLLQVSELTEQVELEAKPGMIIIRSSKNPREGWEEQIQRVLAESGPEPHEEFADLDVLTADGLDEIPWEEQSPK